jgi:hypothetical protein
VVTVINHREPKEDAEKILTWCVKKGYLQLFVERDGRMYRVPHEDLMEWWHEWETALRTGRLPEDIADGLEEDEESTSYAATLRSYKGARPLFNIEHLESFFSVPSPEPLQKSGAAGRPTAYTLL